MKKTIALVLAAVLSLACLAGCGGEKKETLTLNVYNWGEYISDGSEDSYDTVKEFEAWYAENYDTRVNISLITFAINDNCVFLLNLN